MAVTQLSGFLSGVSATSSSSMLLRADSSTEINNAVSVLVDDNVMASTTESVARLIEKISRQYEINSTLALGIARCESHLRQIDKKGEPIRGEKNPEDVGIFQINEKWHLEKSQSLGFNIYTATGNVEYAMWLLKNEGDRHWNYSRSCWSKA